MPTIPDSVIMPMGAPQMQFIPQAQISAPTDPNAGQYIGKALGDVVDVGLAFQKAQRAADYSKAKADIFKSKTDFLIGLEDDPQFRENPGLITEKWNEFKGTVMENARAKAGEDQNLAAALSNHLTEEFSRDDIAVTRLHRKRVVDIGLANTKNEINTYREALPMAKSDDDFGGLEIKARKSVSLAESSGYMTREEGQKELRGFLSEKDTFRARRDILEDPAAAFESLANAENLPDGQAMKYQNLDPGKRMVLAEHAQSEVKRLESEAKMAQREEEARVKEYQATRASVIMGDLEDAAASAMETGKVSTSAFSGARELLSFGGQYSKVGEKYLRKLNKGAESWSFIREHADLPFDQQLAEADAKLKPEPASEGYAEQSALYHNVVKYVSDQKKRATDDPAGYSIPRAAESLRNAGVDPAKAPEALAQKSFEIQKGLGLKQHVLPKESADKLKDEYETADADGKLSIMKSLDAYGSFKPKVLAEIHHSAASQVAQFLLNSNGAGIADARVMIQAEAMKEEDIPSASREKGFVQKTKDNIAASDGYRALTSLAKMQPSNADAQKFAAEFEHVLVRASQIKNDPAYGAKLLERNMGAIADENIAGVFFPKDQAPSNLKDRLRQARQEAVTSIEWQRQMLPPRLFAERARDITERGMWVNAPDGKGFILLHPNGNAITDQAGQPVRTDMNTLRNMERRNALDDTDMLMTRD